MLAIEIIISILITYRRNNGGYGHQERIIIMRGRGGGNFRGGGRGGGNRQGGRGRNDDDSNEPKVECGVFDYFVPSKPDESGGNTNNGTAVFKLCTTDKLVPLTQTFLFDSNNNKIGKIKDVFGPMDKVSFEMEPFEGVLKTIKAGTKVFAPTKRLHPPSFYTDDQPQRRGGGGGGRGRGGRGGGGGGRGGRGGGGGRGGFGGRGGGRGGGGRGRGR